MKIDELMARVKNALKMKDYQLAKRLAEKAILQHPKHWGILTLLGTIYSALNETDNAYSTLSEAIKRNPQNAEAMYQLAKIEKQFGNLDDAKNLLAEAVQIDAGRADIATQLGIVFRLLGDSKKAMDFFEVSVDIDPRYVPAYNNLGNLLKEEGLEDEAFATYKKGLSIDSNHPALNYNYGILLHDRLDEEAAEASFKKALRNKPDWTECLTNLGLVQSDLGKSREALQTFRDVLSLNPDDNKAIRSAGKLLAQLERYAEAEDMLKQLDDVDATLELETVYEKMNQTKQAVAVLDRLIAEDKENPQLYMKKARLLNLSDQLDEALIAAEKASKLFGKVEPLALLSLLSDIHDKKGNFEKAYVCLKKIPDRFRNLELQIKLSYLKYKVGDIDAAYTEIQCLLDDYPDVFDAKLLLAKIYFSEHLYDKAKEILDQLRSQHPENTEILKILAQVYKKLGLHDEAIEISEALFSSTEEEAIDDLKESLDLYEAAILTLPQDFEERWQANLQRLIYPSKDFETLGKKAVFVDEDEFIHEEAEILDVGGIEPIIVINEEEDSIFLSDMEEELIIPEFIPSPEKDEKKEEKTQTAPNFIYSAMPASPFMPHAPASAVHPSPAPVSSLPSPSQGIGQIHQPTQVVEQAVHSENPPQTQPEIEEELEDPLVEDTDSMEQPNESDTDAKDEDDNSVWDDVDQYPEEEEEEEKEEESLEEKASRLLDRLKDMTDYLPEEGKQHFESSDVAEKMQKLKEKLLSKMAAQEHGLERPKQPRAIQLPKEKITSTLEFMGSLSEHLPDRSASDSVKERLRRVLAKLKGEKVDDE